MFTATLETTKGLVKYPFHLGSTEWIARDCARELMRRKWSHELGRYVVRTVSLWENGKLIDTYDGDWLSEIEDRYYRDMELECFA